MPSASSAPFGGEMGNHLIAPRGIRAMVDRRAWISSLRLLVDPAILLCSGLQGCCRLDAQNLLHIDRTDLFC
jgi:hypothetical protein